MTRNLNGPTCEQNANRFYGPMVLLPDKNSPLVVFIPICEDAVDALQETQHITGTLF